MAAIDLEPNTSNAYPEYGYDLPPEAIQQLTSDLLRERPPTGDARFVCYKLDGEDIYSNIGRQVECTVFDEAFGNDASEMRREYGPYEEQSTFFISIDRESERPTGALRVIENGPAGFKTLNDLTEISPEFTKEHVANYHGISDMDKCWDVGTVAVLPEHRSAEGSISVQLYRGLYVAARENDIQHLVSIIDSKPLAKLTGYLGIPFVPLTGSGPMEYLGSPSSQPVYGYTPDFYPKMNRKRFTLNGILARKVLGRLVKGTQDDELQF